MAEIISGTVCGICKEELECVKEYTYDGFAHQVFVCRPCNKAYIKILPHIIKNEEIPATKAEQVDSEANKTVNYPRRF